jgi:hypothetical protein
MKTLRTNRESYLYEKTLELEAKPESLINRAKKYNNLKL